MQQVTKKGTNSTESIDRIPISESSKKMDTIVYGSAILQFQQASQRERERERERETAKPSEGTIS